MQSDACLRVSALSLSCVLRVPCCACAQLLSQVQLDITGKMRIAALRSGYLTPPPKELVRAPRKQARSWRVGFGWGGKSVCVSGRDVWTSWFHVCQWWRLVVRCRCVHRDKWTKLWRRHPASCRLFPHRLLLAEHKCSRLVSEPLPPCLSCRWLCW